MLFHAAGGVRLCHAPDAQVRCPVERRNCRAPATCPIAGNIHCDTKHPGNTCR